MEYQRKGYLCLIDYGKADDTRLLAESKEVLMKLLQMVKKESEKACCYLNLKNNIIFSTEKIEVFKFG